MSRNPPTSPRSAAKKRKFSSFTKSQAFELLHLRELLPWDIATDPVPLTPLFGIVTNGEGWRLYRLDPLGTDRVVVYETPLYSTGDMEQLLGRLRQVFLWCQQDLAPSED